MNYKIIYAKQAQKDAKKIGKSPLRDKVLQLIKLLEEDPFQQPPPFEILIGNLTGAYSRRINIQHRLVYQVYEEQKIVKILRMWTHYGE